MGWLGRTLDRTAHWLLKWRIIRAPARWIANSRYAWSIISRTDRVRANRMETRVRAGKLPQHSGGRPGSSTSKSRKFETIFLGQLSSLT